MNRLRTVVMAVMAIVLLLALGGNGLTGMTASHLAVTALGMTTLSLAGAILHFDLFRDGSLRHRWSALVFAAAFMVFGVLTLLWPRSADPFDRIGGPIFYLGAMSIAIGVFVHSWRAKSDR